MSSISKFTKHHVRPTTRVKKLLNTQPDKNCIWNNNDPCDVSLDNTSDSGEPVNSTTTTASIRIETTPMRPKPQLPQQQQSYQKKNDEIWYAINEESDSWQNATETMDNYQEWINPPTVVGDTNITNRIIEHIDPCIHQGGEHTNSLKSTMLTSFSGW